MASPARIAIIACVAVAGFAAGALLYRARIGGIPRGEQLARLPQNRLRLAIDVQALRTAGIIEKFAGKSAEEPEYLAFVKETGFDYKKDLDLVLASYSAEETLAFLTGNFDWSSLRHYAATHGGACDGDTCRMPASTPGRRLSFARLASSQIAFASSADSEAVTKLTRSSGAKPSLPPSQPIWFLIPPDLLKDTSVLPGAARMFATALSTSREVLIAIDGTAAGYQARLEAECETPEQATQMARELQAATTVLQRTMPPTKGPQTLSGILSAGKFSSENTKITGLWPIDAGFFDAIAGSPE